MSNANADPGFLARLSRRQQRVFMFLAPLLIGGAMGFFVLFPINEYVYYHEHEKFEEDPPTAWKFVSGQVRNSVRGNTPQKTTFYIIVGSVLGLIAGSIFNALQRRTQQIENLRGELEKDLSALIARGESQTVEFKSSFRWDLVQGKVNRALETVVLKTLAGFMNAEGGTLLIGVADDGKILGLQNDLGTLKRKDLDGYEQTLMTAVAGKLGADACSFIHIVFHVIDGNDVCRVIASRATRPVFLTSEGQKHLYLRTGGGTRELDVQEAIEFTSTHWRR